MPEVQALCERQSRPVRTARAIGGDDENGCGSQEVGDHRQRRSFLRGKIERNEASCGRLAAPTHVTPCRPSLLGALIQIHYCFLIVSCPTIAQIQEAS